MGLEYMEKEVDPMFEEYQLKRKRWRKRLDSAEYREKVDEMRGNIEAKVKKTSMQAQWEKFQKSHSATLTKVQSLWDT